MSFDAFPGSRLRIRRRKLELAATRMEAAARGFMARRLADAERCARGIAVAPLDLADGAFGERVCGA